MCSPSQERCEYCSTHFWRWQIVTTAADSIGRGDHLTAVSTSLLSEGDGGKDVAGCASTISCERMQYISFADVRVWSIAAVCRRSYLMSWSGKTFHTTAPILLSLVSISL